MWEKDVKRWRSRLPIFRFDELCRSKAEFSQQEVIKLISSVNRGFDMKSSSLQRGRKYSDIAVLGSNWAYFALVFFLGSVENVPYFISSFWERIIEIYVTRFFFVLAACKIRCFFSRLTIFTIIDFLLVSLSGFREGSLWQTSISSRVKVTPVWLFTNATAVS